MGDRVKTHGQEPATIIDEGITFLIPSYQRPFVWPDEAVLKLFKDIVRACNEGESVYYIGTVLTAPVHHVGGTILELIDGQQRTTTLMLIALAFRASSKETELSKLATKGEAPRLTFAIRDQVQALLGYWAGLDGYQYPGEEAVDKDPYLRRLEGALRSLKQWVQALSPEEQAQISDYIHKNVRWVNNIMPDSMDLNRLFATMNTGGVQLEQAEILKSQLLTRISTDKAQYEAIWQVCEHMDNYFERNVRQVFRGTNWEEIGLADIRRFDPDRFLLSGEQAAEAGQEETGLLISELDDGHPNEAAGSNGEEAGNGGADDTDLDDTVYCRSIIGFPLLLMHALRIYNERTGWDDIGLRLHSDRLIESFGRLVHEASEEEVRGFVECLWEVRYQFDFWVVKWVERAEEEEEQLRLTDISRSSSSGKWYLNRGEKAVSELVPLQSVRYFTGEYSAQYWLTPFLGLLIKEAPGSEEEVLAMLERIDNQLSRTEGTQKAASFELLSGDSSSLQGIHSIISGLEAPKGTKFEHYWFQKLEYLLWKRDKDKDYKVRQYQIVSRNSIEHVHPQNEERGRELEPEILNAFGNLVLLNPGQNSSYGNQSVKKKRADFQGKRDGGGIYDSLKLKQIIDTMGDEDWTPELIRQHQQEMLGLIASHYGSPDNASP